MIEQRRIKHFSMIRSFHLADFMTVANGFRGVGAIFEAMKFLVTGETKRIYLAALLVPLILIFFALCGLSRLARYNITAESLAGESGKVEYFEGTPLPPAIEQEAIVETVEDQLSVIDHIEADIETKLKSAQA